jgi:hypothetical protein
MASAISLRKSSLIFLLFRKEVFLEIYFSEKKKGKRFSESS